MAASHLAFGSLLKGYLLEVRPLPMAAALTAALAGYVWLGPADWQPLVVGLYLTLVFLLLYTAHLADTLVDSYQRREHLMEPLAPYADAGELIPETLLRASTFVTSAAAGVLAIALAWLTGRPWLVPLAGAILALAHNYAGRLDLHFSTEALAYPTGLLAALLGGAYLWTGTLPLDLLPLAVGIWLYTIGGKVLSDFYDLDSDQRLGKRTLVVAYGPGLGRSAGYGLGAAGLASFALAGLLHGRIELMAGSALAALMAGISLRWPPEEGVFVYLAGAYSLLLAVMAKGLGLV